jgi:dTDP-4-dehydrorhamnose reductase
LRIAILGSQGMLGSKIHETAPALGFSVDGISHDDIDITNQNQVKSYFETHQFDVLVNCAAFTRVDDCEEAAGMEMALAVNGEATGFLAQECVRTGRKIVHFSTDYVFDGQKKEPYGETDPVHPVNAYGKSKLEGEKLIQNANPFFYIIRTSWLYGPNGKSHFVKTIANLLKIKPKIQVVKDQVGGPTYTGDLAQFTLELLNRKAEAGLYHFANEGYASWYDFAKEIQSLTGLTACAIEPILAKDFSRKALRPANSRFDLGKSNRALGRAIRPWQEALQYYLTEEFA